MSRKRIGLLLGRLEEDYVSLIWPGIIGFAESSDLDLILFSARYSESKAEEGQDFKYNILNNFVNEHNLDGLVILTGEMGNYMSMEEIRQFCTEFKNLPVVSIAYELPDIPSVIIDNTTGIIQAITHLVMKHKLSQIAFIGGPEDNPEAIERLEAYKVGLQLNGLTFDEHLVTYGNFTKQKGRLAARELLEKTHDSIQAIVAADDVTALGAIEELQEHGFMVPDDIAVVGFDDIEDASFENPPLTTIRQPLYRLGWRSAELCLKKIYNEEAPDVIRLPSEFIIRQSCGCCSNVFSLTNEGGRGQNLSPDSIEDLIKTISRRFREIIHEQEEADKWSADLVSAFMADCALPRSEQFLQVIRKLLFTHYLNKPFESQLHLLDVIDEFKSQFLILDEYETDLPSVFLIFQKAEQFLYDSFLRKEMEKRINLKHEHWSLLSIIEDLIITFDKHELIEILSNRLGELNISTCMLVLYEKEIVDITSNMWRLPRYSQLLLAVTHGERQRPSQDERSFRTEELFLHSFLKHDERKTLIIMPLNFKEEQFGTLVMDFEGNDPIIYETLRTHISSSLKGALLLEEQSHAESELRAAFAKLEMVNKQLHNLSVKDELTGLLNRRGFMIQAKEEFLRAKRDGIPLLLLFIDLDGLKVINDHFGHGEGDVAIKNVAAILQDVFRRNDVLARIGGDEFIVLGLNMNETALEHVSRKIERTLDLFNTKNQGDYNLSASLGGTICHPNDNSLFEELMHQSDEKLYANKKEKYEKRKVKILRKMQAKSENDNKYIRLEE